jgi:hypothetical protein
VQKPRKAVDQCAVEIEDDEGVGHQGGITLMGVRRAMRRTGDEAIPVKCISSQIGTRSHLPDLFWCTAQASPRRLLSLSRPTRQRGKNRDTISIRHPLLLD